MVKIIEDIWCADIFKEFQESSKYCKILVRIFMCMFLNAGDWENEIKAN